MIKRCFRCNAPATGIDGDGKLVCCATCAGHPLGCRCKYGDPANTVNEFEALYPPDELEDEIDQYD